jgi:DNA-binding MarR family transcriptional regulator
MHILTRMSQVPSKAVVSAWMRLMRAQQSALLKIERALREANLPSLSWYDVLLELDRAGDKGLRPVELERQMLIAQSNISRLIDRIEAAGYVERRPCDEDARGQMIVITPAGRDLRKRMWPSYAAAIQNAIGTHVSEREASSLSALLAKLLGTP